MNRLLDYLLTKVIKRGTLQVTWSDGSVKSYGRRSPGFAAHVQFHSKAAERGVALNPELAVGEAYMSGELTFSDASGPLAFLQLADDNWAGLRDLAWTKALARLRYLTRRWRQDNDVKGAKKNVSHHYDLDERLYRLFLDSDMQYSCAYFEDVGDDIDKAQAAKKRHIAAKLALKPGVSVLDIGCGWGGLGLALARLGAGHITGVTLAEEQRRVASDRARAAGLQSRLSFEVKDYRALSGPFDRIVSVGMFEHVGVSHYQEFFDSAVRLLAPDGVMLLHSIARFGRPAASNPWVTKYIFPGGYVPALSEVMPAIERSGLYVTDIEVMRLHYAETLKAWRARFRAHWDEAARLYDERFCRMWDFYLAAFESCFRDGTLMVVQIQLVKDLKALPLTRDYMFNTEERYRANEEFSGARVVPLRSAN